jgi:hypothetical protein
MQHYFSLLPLDHLASKFELFFWLCWFLKRLSKIFPIEADVEMFYHCGGHNITSGDHKLISGNIYVNRSFYGTVVHEKKLFKVVRQSIRKPVLSEASRVKRP